MLMLTFSGISEDESEPVKREDIHLRIHCLTYELSSFLVYWSELQILEESFANCWSLGWEALWCLFSSAFLALFPSHFE